MHTRLSSDTNPLEIDLSSARVGASAFISRATCRTRCRSRMTTMPPSSAAHSGECREVRAQKMHKAWATPATRYEKDKMNQMMLPEATLLVLGA